MTGEGFAADRAGPGPGSRSSLWGFFGAVDGKDGDMTDNVPAGREERPGTRAAAPRAGGVSGAAAPQIDPAALEAAFPHTHHRLELEFGDRRDFHDPRKEWRRLFSELLGTFALVLVAAGGGLLHAKGQISLAAAVVAPGLMVTAIILFMGAVCGAHLNPAVSLAFALRGDFRGSGSRATSSSSWPARHWSACFCAGCSGTWSIWGRRCRARGTTTGRPCGWRSYSPRCWSA